MNILRNILAIIISILFFPIALLLAAGIGLMTVPEMIIDCFMEVSGNYEKNIQKEIQ